MLLDICVISHTGAPFLLLDSLKTTNMITLKHLNFGNALSSFTAKKLDIYPINNPDKHNF